MSVNNVYDIFLNNFFITQIHQSCVLFAAKAAWHIEDTLS